MTEILIGLDIALGILITWFTTHGLALLAAWFGALLLVGIAAPPLIFGPIGRFSAVLRPAILTIAAVMSAACAIGALYG